jgi:hypothetical protein
MSDLFNDALNAPSGRLAELMIKKITAGSEGELPDAVQTRLDRPVSAPGKAGLLARVRIAADVALLFNLAPNWTTSKIVPLFDWSSPEAADLWSARKYSTYIGSPQLFGLLKRPFLQIFGRNETPAEDLDTFADWMAAILIANRAEGAGYPLLDTEARSALRRAGAGTLSAAGHRLAIEMESAPTEKKLEHWLTVVERVFHAIWPLDVELQTPAASFKLIQILLETGDAFPKAVDFILPFIQPDDPRVHSTIFSIAEASEAFYKAAPSKLLDVMAAVVGNAPPGSVYALGKALARLRATAPSLANTRKYQKLLASS